MLHTIAILILMILQGFSNEISQNRFYALPDAPDPFTFMDRFDVEPGSIVTSEPVIIHGLTNSADINLIGGAYSINDEDFTSSPGTISNNDQVRIRLNASTEYGQVTFSEINIGGETAYFAVRTINDPLNGWINVPVILENIKKPDFPDREFNITDFGAVGDGTTLCTNAFINAIDSCHHSGGGKVIVPEGIFFTGAIHLKSNVNLYISEKALIKFSTNPSDYLPVVYTRFEGTECYNYSPLIYAFEQDNIAITGQGTLDGQGSYTSWWAWTQSAGGDVANLRNQAEQGVPVEQRMYGEGHYLRPPMIQPYRCTNVFIDSVTILNGPFWHIHPVLCTDVLVTNISVSGHGPNNDGCNPESSGFVLIRNCTFDTGDDCIAVKSGRNADGRRINTPSENIVIQNCTMKDGHGGVVIGSEITGGARNIYAEECVMDSPNLDRALRIKTNSMRGGVIENIYLRNITVGRVSDAAIRVNYYYGEGDVGNFIPVVKNVEVRNMTCQETNYALRIDGYERSPVSDLRLIDCKFIK
jgi:polygalacturonase